MKLRLDTHNNLWAIDQWAPQMRPPDTRPASSRRVFRVRRCDADLHRLRFRAVRLSGMVM